MADGRAACLRCLVLLIALLAGDGALAHRLKVFASAEGEQVQGSVYFVGGTPAAGAAISVRDAQDRELLRLSPDADGRFGFKVDRRIDHVIVADSGDGHAARWMVKAGDLPGRLPAGRDGSPATPGAAAVPADSPPDTRGDVIVAQVEQAVSRQLRPLREQLLAYEERVRLHDVLGGIGYIVGLAGLGLWWRAGRRGGGR